MPGALVDNGTALCQNAYYLSNKLTVWVVLKHALETSIRNGECTFCALSGRAGIAAVHVRVGAAAATARVVVSAVPPGAGPIMEISAAGGLFDQLSAWQSGSAAAKGTVEWPVICATAVSTRDMCLVAWTGADGRANGEALQPQLRVLPFPGECPVIRYMHAELRMIVRHLVEWPTQCCRTCDVLVPEHLHGSCLVIVSEGEGVHAPCLHPRLKVMYSAPPLAGDVARIASHLVRVALLHPKSECWLACLPAGNVFMQQHI